jgi:hypothetical protein
MKIREYYPGLAATPNDVFLELQMYAAGQNVLSGHEIWVYDSTDTPPEPSVHELNPGPPLPNAQNQRSVLIGGSNVPGRDYPEEFQHDPAGGAICFVSTSGFGEIDCVEWGVGDPMVNAGNPAAPTGIPDGQSLNRSIAPGCATLLEDSDDTNDSATDFALGVPSPRNNAAVPTETDCSGGGPGPGPGPGGGSGDTNPPETTITKAPDKVTEKAKAKVKFQSNEAGSDFMCKLDKGTFKSCSSPFKKRIDLGKHKFQVFAIDDAGNEDKSPAKAKFKRVEA